MNEKLRKGMAVRHNGAALCPLTYGHDFNCSDPGGLARNTIGRISWEKQSCWTTRSKPRYVYSAFLCPAFSFVQRALWPAAIFLKNGVLRCRASCFCG